MRKRKFVPGRSHQALPPAYLLAGQEVGPGIFRLAQVLVDNRHRCAKIGKKQVVAVGLGVCLQPGCYFVHFQGGIPRLQIGVQLVWVWKMGQRGLYTFGKSCTVRGLFTSWIIFRTANRALQDRLD